MAALRTALCCALLFSGTAALDCAAKSATSRLQASLLCGYDKTELPLVNRSATFSVSVRLFIAFIKLDEGRNTLEVHAWTNWMWTDESLKWKPRDYEGITNITIPAEAIWVPDTVLQTSSAWSEQPVVKPTAQCFLSYEGLLSCSIPTLYETHCDPDLTHWPFDTHRCSMELMPRTIGGKMNYKFSNYTRVLMLDVAPSKEWQLLRVEPSSHVTTVRGVSVLVLRYGFLLQRHSTGHAATVVAPAVVLSSLTLVTFWLHPRGAERIVIGGVNVVSHCLYLQYLGFKLRSSGDQCPLIVRFYRDSLGLAGAALLLGVLARRLAGNPRGSCPCLEGAVNWMVDTRLFQLLLQLPPKGEAWLLLDRLSFLGFAAALVALLLRLVL